MPALYPGVPDQENAIVESIVKRVKLWEDSVGKDFRLKYEELYRQYRGFKEWKADWLSATSENDRDIKYSELRKRWGARLHIPLSFMAVETIVPRAIANSPHLTYLPRDERWQDNVRAVQQLVDWQQEAISIELPFQRVMRAGLINGLGVGKCFWDRKSRSRSRMEERPIPLPAVLGGRYRLSQRKPEVYFDGPRFESVDVGDFIWDPYGYDMASCDWTAQRIWLSLEKVLERLQNGSWQSVSAKTLSEDDVRQLPGSNQRYDELWQARMRESGFTTQAFSQRGEQIHELIEYHNGDQVFAILDRQLLVNVADNPCGEMPYQVYRPVELEHQMVGLGVLEPLTHLQREFDTMRSQRRDATTLSLKAPTAYDDTRVRADEIDFDPTGLIPIEGDPRAAILQFAPKEVPGTSFEEEASIRGDIKEVAGLADAPEQTPATATEAQLAQAQTSLRIELLSQRFESEIVHPVACQFLWYDQREIRTARTMTAPTEPGEQQQEAEDPEYRAPYKSIEVDPGVLEGDYEIKVAKGSLAAKNIPQERSDAQILLNSLAHDWYIDPLKPRLEAMRKLGIERPQDWLRPPQPALPMGVLRLLLKAGVPAELIQRAVITARTIEEPQRSGADQVADMGQPAQ
jgi:hypothetical protein